MNDATTSLQTIKDAINKFVTERDWQCYHNAKNASMAIAIEAAELMEIFQWAQSEDIANIMHNKQEMIEDELVDIMWMVFSFSNQYNIDLSTAFARKFKKNETKYPIEKAKGSTKKYTEL